jgi:hypothetical protein
LPDVCPHTSPGMAWPATMGRHRATLNKSGVALCNNCRTKAAIYPPSYATPRTAKSISPSTTIPSWSRHLVASIPGAPINHARLKKRLVERGYVLRDGDLGGPGSAVPSADKLQALIGSCDPFECKVIFSQPNGPFRWFEPAHNEFGLIDSGNLKADGIHLQLSGRRSGVPGFFGSLFQRHMELNWRSIFDVELDENVVHLAYHPSNVGNRSITLWLPNRSAAERLATILPRERTATFRPQLRAHVEFERHLLAQSPQTPVTVGLVAINVLVFLTTVLSGQTLIEWGSNFGPYTTGGEWWRLFTSLFLHAGVLHLLFNMWCVFHRSWTVIPDHRGQRREVGGGSRRFCSDVHDELRE